MPLEAIVTCIRQSLRDDLTWRVKGLDPAAFRYLRCRMAGQKGQRGALAMELHNTDGLPVAVLVSNEDGWLEARRIWLRRRTKSSRVLYGTCDTIGVLTPINLNNVRQLLHRAAAMTCPQSRNPINAKRSLR
jgi:hypothetical protein